MTRSADLATYYQRGAIFENLLMAELSKHLFHTYRKTDLYFWRDSHALEVDILLEQGTSLRVAEVKSSETINSAFFSNMEKFAALAPEFQVKKYLLFGGSESLEHLGAQVLGWRSARQLLA